MVMDPEEFKRRDRARARANYPGEIVRAGSPKAPLYQDLKASERLARMSALCEAQWVVSGRTLQHHPRAEWPGEVFRIAHG